MAKLVSKTYGEALFEIAMEQEKQAAFLDEVSQIEAVLKSNPEFDRLMLHPAVPKSEKLALCANVFDTRVSGEMAGFLKLVVQKERYGELPEIFRYFTERMKEELKIGTAYVTTAVELSEKQKEQVRERLLACSSYRTMEMYYQVDQSLIGGMVIRIKDRVVDSSIRTGLENLTKQLLQIQLG